MDIALEILMRKLHSLTRQFAITVESGDVIATSEALTSVNDAVWLALYTIEVLEPEPVEEAQQPDPEEQPNPRGRKRKRDRVEGGRLELSPPPGASEEED